MFFAENNLEEIFDKLDEKDGSPDGQIDCEFLHKFANEEDLHKKLGMKKSQIETLISEADQNEDGFINKEEFVSFIRNRLKSKKLKRSTFRQYCEKLAYAEEFTCCPPPLFIIIITFLQIFFFAMNRYYYPVELEPKCSYFIFL